MENPNTKDEDNELSLEPFGVSENYYLFNLDADEFSSENGANEINLEDLADYPNGNFSIIQLNKPFEISKLNQSSLQPLVDGMDIDSIFHTDVMDSYTLSEVNDNQYYYMPNKDTAIEINELTEEPMTDSENQNLPTIEFQNFVEPSTSNKSELEPFCDNIETAKVSEENHNILKVADEQIIDLFDDSQQYYLPDELITAKNVNVSTWDPCANNRNEEVIDIENFVEMSEPNKTNRKSFYDDLKIVKVAPTDEENINNQVYYLPYLDADKLITSNDINVSTENLFPNDQDENLSIINIENFVEMSEPNRSDLEPFCDITEIDKLSHTNAENHITLTESDEQIMNFFAEDQLFYLPNLDTQKLITTIGYNETSLEPLADNQNENLSALQVGSIIEMCEPNQSNMESLVKTMENDNITHNDAENSSRFYESNEAIFSPLLDNEVCYLSSFNTDELSTTIGDSASTLVPFTDNRNENLCDIQVENFVEMSEPSQTNMGSLAETMENDSVPSNDAVNPSTFGEANETILSPLHENNSGSLSNFDKDESITASEVNDLSRDSFTEKKKEKVSILKVERFFEICKPIQSNLRDSMENDNSFHNGAENPSTLSAANEAILIPLTDNQSCFLSSIDTSNFDEEQNFNSSYYEEGELLTVGANETVTSEDQTDVFDNVGASDTVINDDETDVFDYSDSDIADYTETLHSIRLDGPTLSSVLFYTDEDIENLFNGETEISIIMEDAIECSDTNPNIPIAQTAKKSMNELNVGGCLGENQNNGVTMNENKKSVKSSFDKDPDDNLSFYDAEPYKSCIPTVINQNPFIKEDYYNFEFCGVGDDVTIGRHSLPYVQSTNPSESGKLYDMDKMSPIKVGKPKSILGPFMNKKNGKVMLTRTGSVIQVGHNKYRHLCNGKIENIIIIDEPTNELAISIPHINDSVISVPYPPSKINIDTCIEGLRVTWKREVRKNYEYYVHMAVISNDGPETEFIFERIYKGTGSHYMIPYSYLQRAFIFQDTHDYLIFRLNTKNSSTDGPFTTCMWRIQTYVKQLLKSVSDKNVDILILQ